MKLSRTVGPTIYVKHFSAAMDHKKLVVERVKISKAKLPKEQLKFGKTFSDHMLEIDWSKSSGWSAPKISPYQNFSIDPAASVFHYGIECFEGMKAYLDDRNQIRMFRPEKNMERMNNSLARLELPRFPGNEFLECIMELLRQDKSWIPQGRGYSLYIRPTAISTYPYVGVCPSEQMKLYVICSPVGPYYPTGFKPVRLLADPRYVRAWPGGTGAAKIGGNYAMTLAPQHEASLRNYQQILWLFGDQLQVTEVGTMNQFFFLKRKDGKKELLTAPLDGTILPGVTRDSILALCRDWNEFIVSERPYNLPEIIDAIKDGRMLEGFGAGTAAIVAPVECLHFDGVDYKVPLGTGDSKEAGELSARLVKVLMDIQYGGTPYKDWSVIVPEK